jgi:hypothetical protein
LDAAFVAAGSALTTKDLRSRLFLVTDPADVFLLVYAHASLVRLASIRPEHRDNAFVGRLALGHLFHMAVVIERVIAARSGSSGLFAAQAAALSHALGGMLKKPVRAWGKQDHVGDINAQQKADPDRILRSLLDGTACYAGRAVLPVDVPLCVAYVLRNIGAHHSAAPDVVAERIEALRTHMLACLAACIETYY